MVKTAENHTVKGHCELRFEQSIPLTEVRTSILDWMG
jgi:hypothetical protein